MLYVDQKYVGIISSRLRNFKRKGSSLYVWACTECGDSKKKKKSAHSYAFPADDGLRVYCQRCGYSVWFGKFLKGFDEEVYQEYLLEKFQDQDRHETDFDRASHIAASSSTPKFRTIDLGLPRISDLPSHHPGVGLCMKRMIPVSRWSDLYHADDFMGLVRRFDPEKKATFTEPRLVIPIRSVDGGLLGFQGRSYEKNTRTKYMTTRIDRDRPFMYGQDVVDFSKRVVVVEGPIDSMFLDNGIASAGGVVERELEKYALPRDRFTVAYDNEPRSDTTIKKMRAVISKGYPIFIWDERNSCKDFNDWYISLIESGVDPGRCREIMMNTINKRTFSDVEAELELQAWSRA